MHLFLIGAAMFTICAVLAMTTLITAQHRAARVFVPISASVTDGHGTGVYFSDGSGVVFIPLRAIGKSMETARR